MDRIGARICSFKVCEGLDSFPQLPKVGVDVEVIFNFLRLNLYKKLYTSRFLELNADFQQLLDRNGHPRFLVWKGADGFLCCDSLRAEVNAG